MLPLQERRALREIERGLRRDRRFTLRLALLQLPPRRRRMAALAVVETCCLAMALAGGLTGYWPLVYLAAALAVDVPTVAIIARKLAERARAQGSAG